MRLAWIVLAMLWAAAAQAADPARNNCDTLPNTPVRGEAWAIDGDTIALVSKNERAPNVRLWGINAPELLTFGRTSESRVGMQSRVALDDILFASARRVSCVAIEWDRHCRIVARCVRESPQDGDADISLAMVRAGFAYVLTTYAVRPPYLDVARRYFEAEREAREAHRGLWPTLLGMR